MDERFELTTENDPARLVERLKAVLEKHATEWKNYDIEIEEDAVLMQPRFRLFSYPWPIFKVDLAAEIEKVTEGQTKLMVDTNIGPRVKTFAIVIASVSIIFQVLWFVFFPPHEMKQWFSYVVINASTLLFVLITALQSHRRCVAEQAKLVAVMRQMFEEL